MAELSGHKLKAVLFCLEMMDSIGYKAYQHPDFKPEYITLHDLLQELKQT